MRDSRKFYARDRPAFAGFVLCGGGERMLSSRPDGYLTTADAARLVGVSPATIRQWRARGHLALQGLDEKRYPLHTPEAVRDAERRVRANGIAKGGFDPRRTRGRTRQEAA